MEWILFALIVGGFAVACWRAATKETGDESRGGYGTFQDWDNPGS